MHTKVPRLESMYQRPAGNWWPNLMAKTESMSALGLGDRVSTGVVSV